VVLELGTGLGVSTLFLAAGSPGTPLHTIEGNRARADFSSELFKRSGLSAVKVHVGEMEQKLDELSSLARGRLLAFVDGNHRYGPTIGYIRWIIDRAGEEAVVILDDIYWSKDMYKAWKEIISWREVRVCIDLFHMGILLLRMDLHKEEVKVKF
jgi:predicted O-methyltransferase YrrM